MLQGVSKETKKHTDHAREHGLLHNLHELDCQVHTPYEILAAFAPCVNVYSD